MIDEVQKAAGWSESVKRLWDEDSRRGLPLRVVLLGSAPLLVEQGLSESLAGRFEVIRVPHWSLAEMRAAFGTTLDEYVYFGGYPGAAPLIGDEARWRRYILDALVETTISRDVLLLTRVDKPALLRRLFELGCRYSGPGAELHQDAGPTPRRGEHDHPRPLPRAARRAPACVTGLPKFSGNVIRRRASSPKLQVLNTALATAQSGRSFDDARADGETWGRLVESAVGAHLANAAATGGLELSWWREGDREVDFVLSGAGGLAAIEVKSGRAPASQPGIAAFMAAFAGLGPIRPLLVGGDGIPLERFLLEPAERWVAR